MNLFIGKEIEITHINTLVKSIGIVFHHNCSPEEIMLPESQEKAKNLLLTAIKYLQMEGFISPEDDYIVHMGATVNAK